MIILKLVMGLVIGLTILVIPTASPAKSLKELNCLSRVIYHEARGETLEGKLAVGYVVMNRTRNASYPNSVCSVTLQPKQFSNFNLNLPIAYASEAWEASLDSARKVYYNKVRDPTKGALFFFNPKKAQPSWRNKFTHLTDIGNHRFLTTKEHNVRTKKY